MANPNDKNRDGEKAGQQQGGQPGQQGSQPGQQGGKPGQQGGQPGQKDRSGQQNQQDGQPKQQGGTTDTGQERSEDTDKGDNAQTNPTRDR